MELIKSGIPELDRLLGGGLERGKAYLVESTIGAKARFIISAFFRQGYLDGELCRIDSLDDSYSEVIGNLRDSGFDAVKSAAEDKLLILDFEGDLIYGSKVSGPYMSRSSYGRDLVTFENLYHVAWDETKKLKASANGLRIAVHGLSSVIRDFGAQSALKFIVSQVDFLKRQGAIIMLTINPDTMTPTDLATFEESCDGIIELTVKEEKMGFQRYIRVKSSSLSSFRMEKLPYEIVGTQEGISIGSKITENFESFRANFKMNQPGVLDVFGDRSYIQSVRVMAKLYTLLFEELGYDRAMNLLYRVGAETVAGVTKEYSERLKVDIDQPTPNLPGLAKTFFSFVAMTGYGELELVKFDQAQNIIQLRLLKSPVAQALSNFGKPVDAYIAGCIAGGLRLILGGNVVCEETLCVAKGDDYCEFKARQE